MTTHTATLKSSLSYTENKDGELVDQATTVITGSSGELEIGLTNITRDFPKIGKNSSHQLAMSKPVVKFWERFRQVRVETSGNTGESTHTHTHGPAFALH